MARASSISASWGTALFTMPQREASSTGMVRSVRMNSMAMPGGMVLGRRWGPPRLIAPYLGCG